MLMIVAASHNWYLQACLDQTHDAGIEPTDTVLRCVLR